MTPQEEIPYSDCPNSDYQINKAKTELKRIKKDCFNRLKEQYKITKQEYNGLEMTRYNAMRLFCLDTQLISFNDIELMEYEVNSSF